MASRASVPAEASAPVETPCPRCKKPLADPCGLGWCQSCGYCRSLEEDRARLPLDKPVAKDQSAALLPSTPPLKFAWWPVVLLVGVALLAAACYAASRHYPLTALQRAAWTSIQIAAGVALIFAGQCYALIVLAPKDEGLNFTDAVVPFKLYGLIFRNLPRTRLTLWFTSWGLTLVVSALICVGGLGYWLKVLPKSSQSQVTQLNEHRDDVNFWPAG
jgi:hypothetical protein